MLCGTGTPLWRGCKAPAWEGELGRGFAGTTPCVSMRPHCGGNCCKVCIQNWQLRHTLWHWAPASARRGTQWPGYADVFNQHMGSRRAAAFGISGAPCGQAGSVRIAHQRAWNSSPPAGELA